MVLEPERLCFLSGAAFKSGTIELAAVARPPLPKEPRALAAAPFLSADSAERKTIACPKIGSLSLTKLCLIIRTGVRRRYGAISANSMIESNSVELSPESVLPGYNYARC